MNKRMKKKVEKKALSKGTKETKSKKYISDIEPKDIEQKVVEQKSTKGAQIPQHTKSTQTRKIVRGVPIVDINSPQTHVYRSIAEAARILGENYTKVYNIVRHNTENKDLAPIILHGQILQCECRAEFNDLYKLENNTNYQRA